jgi:hypothetical protein
MRNIRSVQSANEVHQALKAALKSMSEAEKCAVICFGEIMERKLYRELGYGSMNQYAEVESGELGNTAARVIAPVVDQSNENVGWILRRTTRGGNWKGK